ncbi:methyltransferase [Candidatus Pacearchaeota archaeon]|nr:methyltransferase [Candidatus Pacearchaeota archaeon]
MGSRAGDDKAWEIVKAAKRGVPGAVSALGGALRYLGAEIGEFGDKPFPRMTSAGQVIDTPMGMGLGKDIERKGGEIEAKYREKAAAPEIAPDPEFLERPWYDPERLAATTIEATPLTVGAMGAGALTTVATRNPFLGATVSAIIFGGTSAGQILEEAEGAGIDRGKALEAARLAGLGEAALEYVPGYMFMRLLKSGKPINKTISRAGLKELTRLKTLAKNAGKLTVAESLEEGAQTAKDNMIARGYYDSERAILKDVPESMAVGGIMGLGLGGAGGGINLQQQKKKLKALEAEIAKMPDTQLPPEQRTAVMQDLQGQLYQIENQPTIEGDIFDTVGKEAVDAGAVKRAREIAEPVPEAGVQPEEVTAEGVEVAEPAEAERKPEAEEGVAISATTFALSDEQKANIKAGKPPTGWEEQLDMGEKVKGAHGKMGLPRPQLIGEGALKDYKVGDTVSFNGRTYKLLDAIKGRKEFYKTEFKVENIKTGKKSVLAGYHHEAEVKRVAPVKVKEEKEVEEPKSELDTLIEQYEATGRTATRDLKKKTISLNGKTPMPEASAIKSMRMMVEIGKPYDPPTKVSKEKERKVLGDIAKKLGKEPGQPLGITPKEKAQVLGLRKIADGMEKQIEAKLHPPVSQQTVTARRARMADGMRETGQAMQELQKYIRVIAEEVEQGTIAKSLAGVKNKKQVEYLRVSSKYNHKWPAVNLSDSKWVVEQARTDQALLKRMDITNALEYRQAVKDFGALELEPRSKADLEADRLRELENKLIGTKIPGFFPTPKPVINHMLDEAGIEAGMKILEPSAGKGDIADSIREAHPDAKLSVIEYQQTLHEILEAKGYEMAGHDFLEHKGRYDRIVMNPPFEKGQDIDHVRHAYGLLKKGGRLVSVMSEAGFFRDGKKYEGFRDWLEEVGGVDEKLEAGSFKGAESFRQTGVAARVVVIDKGEAVEETEAMRDRYAAGALHVGFFDQAQPVIETATEEIQEPLRREAILKPLFKALNVGLYKGRIKGKALGFARRVINEVRIKKMSDLEVVAHEVAHVLDDRIPEIKKTYRNATYRDELRSVSYDQKKTNEGFAEFVRLWMTQPEEAKTRTPNFYEWFEEFVERSEYGDILKSTKVGMMDWYGQGGLARAKSKIGVQENVNDVLDNYWDGFRQSVSDDLHGIYKAERELTGGVIPVGAYETARLTRAAYSVIDGTIDLGAIKVNEDGSHSFVGKSLTDILDPVGNELDNWTTYAVGRSAKELYSQGREHLFDKKEIDAMVALETPEFKQAFDDYQVWNKAIVDFAQAKGLINPESRKLWQRMQYIPFYREGTTGQTKRKGGTEGNWKGIQKLTGGTENIRNVLENMITNASNLITEALKNEARVEMAKLVERTPQAAKWMVKIPKDTKSLSIDKEQMQSYVLKSLGLDPSLVKAGLLPEGAEEAIKVYEKMFEDAPDYMNFWAFGQHPQGENVIAVLRGGKPVFYEVADPVLYRAIASFNRPQKNWIVKLLSSIRRIGQTSITLSFDFMGANIARDTLMGSIMSRSGFKPVIDSARGMKSRIVKDQDYRDFIANGGGFASYLVDERALRGHIERFYKKKGFNLKHVIDTPAKLLFMLETIADSFEVSTRIGEYKRAVARGEHPRHAAYQAREVSTDFAMRGDSEVLGFFYDSVMFLKAGVNGIDRLYRGLAHDPNKGAIAAKSATLAMLSAALYLFNKGNPEYDDLPDWEKDVYWHFFVPTPNGGTIHFRYPKIWEIGALASIAERTMELLTETHDFKKYAKDVARVATDMFKMSVIPHAVTPLYEQATNRIGFIDSPIETPSMQQVQPWARSSPYGSRVLRDIGEATRKLPRKLQISPARAEALLRGYFNTWAMYGLLLADAALYDDIPDMSWEDYPGVRRFVRPTPLKRAKYESQFYDALKEVTELRRTMRRMDQYADTRYFADEIEAGHRKALVSDYSQLTTVNKRLNGLYAEMRAVIKSDKTSAAKRIELDKLTQKKNVLLKQVMTEINEGE